MIYALFLLSSFTGVLCSALIKIFRKSVNDSKFADGLYYAINISVALLYFAILCKFNLSVNAVTLLFSAIFSVTCYLGILWQLRALEDTTMVNVNLFSSAGSLIVSAVAGALVFGEKIGIKSFAGFLLTLLSIFVPYIAAKKQGSGLKGILFCCLLFLNSGLVRIIMKLYQTTPGCMNENIFCFYTNVFLGIFVLIVQRKVFFEQNIISKTLKNYKKPALIAAAAVVATNTSTLLSMVIVGKVDLFFSSVFGPPLTICINFLFDTFLFKNKVTVSTMLSIVIAIAAMIVMI